MRILGNCTIPNQRVLMQEGIHIDSYRTRFEQPVRWSAIVGGGLLTAAIAAVDMMLPLGIAGGIPYIAPVMLAMWLPDRRLVFAVAALCSVLIVGGMFWSPPGAGLAIVLPNRGLAVAALWIVAVLTFQRRNVERALAASEASKHAVLETTADGIALLGPDGNIISANPAFIRMFGLSGERLDAVPFSSLLSRADAERLLAHPHEFLKMTRDGDPQMHELEGVRSDEGRFPIETVFVPIDLGSTPRFTVTVRDISERRMLEKHLLHVNDQERRALGYSVHEEFGQALTGVSLIGRQLARRLEDRKYVEAREASELAELLQELDQQALDLFRAISPLDAVEHFHEAAAGIFKTVAARRNVDVSFHGEAIHPPSDVFRAAQLADLIRTLVTSVVDQDGISGLVVTTRSDMKESAIELCVPDGGRGPMNWGTILRPFAYRAKVIDVRLDVDDRSESSCIRCSWSHVDPPENGIDADVFETADTRTRETGA